MRLDNNYNYDQRTQYVIRNINEQLEKKVWQIQKKFIISTKL